MRVAKPRAFLARDRKDGPHVNRLAVAVRSIRAADVLKSRGQDTHDLKCPSRQSNGAADDAGVAVEPAHPQRVTEDDDAVVTFDLIVSLELPAQRRRGSQQ